MKKFILTAILTLILFSILSFSCFAWVPSYQFTCYIDYLQIPDGAVYVDLLLPISQNDDKIPSPSIRIKMHLIDLTL